MQAHSYSGTHAGMHTPWSPLPGTLRRPPLPSPPLGPRLRPVCACACITSGNMTVFVVVFFKLFFDMFEAEENKKIEEKQGTQGTLVRKHTTVQKQIQKQNERPEAPSS